MNCHVPVLCSDLTALPEVAGDAALLADPYSVDSITKALIRITEEKELRDQLISKGIERKKMFNWDTSAHKIWEIFEKELHP